MSNDDTRTRLFGLFLAAPALTAPQLVALGAPLGLLASNVKSHLSRLVAEGVVQRRGPRRLAVYSLTAQRRPVVEGINLRLAPQPDEPWDGTMLMLAVRMPAKREAREALRAALWFDGFRPWGREVWLRPAWPLPWAAERAQAYVAGGVAVGLQGTLVGTPNVAAIKALYASERLDREASALAAAVEKQSRRVWTPAQAFAARQILAGRVVDVISRDPRVPRALSGGEGLARLRAAYRRLMAATEEPARAFVQSVVG